MARPIRETPILFGEDGRRFEELARNAQCTISDSEYDEMKKSYNAVMKCFENGSEISRYYKMEL